MIARMWHGRVPSSKKEAYLEYLNQTGIPDYKSTKGNLGVDILIRTIGGETHFLLVSYWESFDVIRAFAGKDIEKARYYPEDKKYLQEFEPNVVHYEVVNNPDNRIRQIATT
jgi:heme-degrading monooxygenase HmoA